MKGVNLLITSVGGKVIPNIIKSLREDKKMDYDITGVDMNKEAVGKNYCDDFYTVPSGQSPDYINKVFDLCIKKNIDIIIPFSDEEVLTLAQNKNYFSSEGINILCSDSRPTKLSNDKGEMLSFLDNKGLEVPNYYLPKNLKEFKIGVKKIGYPDKDIVCKPRFSSGGRGFRIIKADFNETEHVFNNKQEVYISYTRILKLLNQTKESFPEILLMEYLPGKDFNIDVLANKGETIHIIPNERLAPDFGPVEIGMIRQDNKVKEMTKKIVDVFKFDHLINVEMAYSEKGEPLIYEINPRPSAAIIANKVAGIDLLNEAIYRMLDIEVKPKDKFNKTKMIRFWNEYFSVDKQNKYSS